MLTFLGSKLFLLFLLDADNGEEDILDSLFGDIILLFIAAIENFGELLPMVDSGDMDDANFISSEEALFNSTGLVFWVINLYKAWAGIAMVMNFG